MPQILKLLQDTVNCFLNYTFLFLQTNRLQMFMFLFVSLSPSSRVISFLFHTEYFLLLTNGTFLANVRHSLQKQVAYLYFFLPPYFFFPFMKKIFLF